VKCDELARLLAEYSEGQAAAPLCAEIERHLRECNPCAELERDLEDLRRLCRGTPSPRLPGDVRARIEALLRGRSG
jgi:hypothetical protein